MGYCRRVSESGGHRRETSLNRPWQIPEGGKAMKYRKASDILPDHLLKEIQKYVSGEILYIPSRNARAKWGEGSGAKAFYAHRNEEIRAKYFSGKTLEELAEEYALSPETLRKIVYK